MRPAFRTGSKLLLMAVVAVLFAGTLILSRRMLHSSEHVEQWRPLGPFATDVAQLEAGATDGEVYVAAGYGGLWKSVDAGANWRAHSLGFGWQSVSTLALDPSDRNTIVASSIGRGIRRSTDGGASWTDITGDLEEDSVNVVAIVPAQAPGSLPTLLAGREDLYRSDDDGHTWVKVIAAQSGELLQVLAVSPDAAANVYAASDSGTLLISRDAGLSWQVVTDSMPAKPFGPFTFDPHTPSTMFASTVAGVYKSTDGGSTWALLGSGLPHETVTAITIDPTNGNTVYAAIAGKGVYRSRNGGGQWQPYALSPETLATWDLAVSRPTGTYLYLAGRDGVGVVNIATNQFTTISAGVQSTNIVDLAVSRAAPETLLLAMASTIYRSDDGGTSWRRSEIELPRGVLTSVAFDQHLPHLAYASSTRGYYRSTDRGVTWSSLIEAGDGGANGIVADPHRPGVAYAHTGNALLWTEDAGETWDRVPNMPTEWVSAVALHPRQPSLIAIGSAAEIFISTDGGATWDQHPLPCDQGACDSDMATIVFDAADPETIFVGTLAGDVLRSTDGGEQWRVVSTRMPYCDGQSDDPATCIQYAGFEYPSINDILIDPADTRTIYRAHDRGLYRSQDRGDTWTKVEDGLPDTRIVTLASVGSHDRRTIYAATHGRGVFALD